jgi:hypothetical protein
MHTKPRRQWQSCVRPASRKPVYHRVVNNTTDWCLWAEPHDSLNGPVFLGSRCLLTYCLLVRLHLSVLESVSTRHGLRKFRTRCNSGRLPILGERDRSQAGSIICIDVKIVTASTGLTIPRSERVSDQSMRVGVTVWSKSSIAMVQ